MRRLNTRLLLILILGTLAFVVGAHTLHAFQVQWNADKVLLQAGAAAKDGKLDRAIKLYDSYTRQIPDNGEAWLAAAKVAVDRLKLPYSSPNDRDMARGVLEKALFYEPDDSWVLETLSEMVPPSEALVYLQKLLEKRPNDVNLMLKLAETYANYKLIRYSDAQALLEELIGKYKPVQEVLEKPVDVYDLKPQPMIDASKAKAPQLVRAYALMAELLHDKAARRDEAAADEYIRCMVKNNPNDGMAYYIRWVYGKSPLREMAAELEAAKATLGADPRNADLKAQFELKSKEFELKRKLWLADLDTAYDLTPHDKEIYKEIYLEKVRSDYYQRARFEPDEQIRTKAVESVLAQLAQALEEYKQPDVYLVAADIYASAKSRKAAIDILQMGIKELPNRMSLQLRLLELQLQELQEEHFPPEKMPVVRQRLAEVAKSPMAAEDRQKHAYLTACLKFGERDFQTASRLLEKLRAELEPVVRLQPRSQDLLSRVTLLLSKTYEILGQSDRVPGVVGSIAGSGPSTNAKFQAIAALIRSKVAAGRRSEALTDLTKLRSELGDDAFFRFPEMCALTFQLLVQEQARLPTTKQDWKPAEDFLQSMQSQGLIDESEFIVRRAETILAARGEYDKARQDLQRALATANKSESLWTALARIEAMQNGWPRGLDILTQARAAVGDTVGLRARQAQYVAFIGGAQMRQKLTELGSKTDQFSEADRILLFSNLTDVYYNLREFDEARRAMTEVARLKPKDGEPQFKLFRIARDQSNLEGVQAAATALKTIVGPADTRWMLAEATWFVLSSDQGDKSKGGEKLASARQLLREINVTRPAWEEADRLEALLCYREGNMDGFLEQLLAALRNGPPNPTLMRQVLPMLVAKGRRDEAERLLNRLEPDQQSLELREFATDLLLLRDREAAFAKAREIVDAAPSISAVWWWYGNFLTAAGKSADAEQAYRKAVALDPKSPDAWLGLVGYLARERRKADAEDELRRAEISLAPDVRAVVLGQGYQFLGDIGQAERYYVIAADAAPQNLGLVRNLASFYVATNQPDKALPRLQKLIEGKDATGNDGEHRAWARREIAKLKAKNGDYPQQLAAVALVRENTVAGRLYDEDALTVARILGAREDSASRREAKDLLERLVKVDRKQVPLVDRLLLAQLYDQLGMWKQAQEILLQLISEWRTPEANQPRAADAGSRVRYAELLGHYVRMLIDHSELDSAAVFLTSLEQEEPGAAPTKALKARLLVKQQKKREALAVLRSILPNPLPADQQQRLIEVAELAGSLGFHEEAELLYRDYVTARPEGVLMLAEHLGLHGSIKEAFDLCEKPLQTNQLKLSNLMKSLRVAVMTLRARQAQATSQDYDRVEGWIKRGLSADPDSAALKLKYAELLELRGKYADVERLYLEVLALPLVQKDPINGIDQASRAIAANNLAYLLSILKPGQTDDALTLVAEAVQAFGPVRDVLDTRAMVYYAKGDLPAALRDLREVLLDHNDRDLEDHSFAQKYFHLALVEHRSGDVRAAQKSFATARQLKLLAADLPQAERVMYQDLEKALMSADAAAPASASKSTISN